MSDFTAFTEAQLASLQSDAPSPQEDDGSVRFSLSLIEVVLKHGAFSPEDLKARGGNPDASATIVLERHGVSLIPAFQFDPAGQIVPVVKTVNEFLDSHIDPWGVGCWWLMRHVYLPNEQVPADLIGTDNVLLMKLAQHVREG